MTLFWLCLAWMAGIALAPLTAFPLAALSSAGIILILLAAVVPRRFRLVFCCLAFGFLGGARWSLARPLPDDSFLGSYWNRSVTMDLLLDEDAVPSGNGIRFRAHVERVQTTEVGDWSAVDGMALVEFRARPSGWAAVYGTRLRVAGVLQQPPEADGFDYPAYLARQGIYAVLADPSVHNAAPGHGNPVLAALAAFRRQALVVLRALFPEPEGSLLAGILLGDDSGISADVQTAFARTGTSHIVAISGFNISIVAAIFLALTRGIPRRWHGWLIAAAGILVYTVLVGASASVVRAAVMGLSALLARQIGRQSHGLTSLAFSGAVMTLANPGTLWDVGFELSFTATLGLILYADPMQKGVERILGAVVPGKRAGALAALAGEVFLLTLAAQITTLPLLLFYFQSFSLGALVINPLVLSVQPLVMVAGGLAVLSGMVWLPAGRLLGWLAWAPTAYTIRVVQWGASFPAGWWPVGVVPVWQIALFYGGLFALTGAALAGKLPVWRAGKTIAARLSTAGIPFLAAAAFVAWNAYFLRPDGRLRLVAANTGQGEIALLRSPSGGTVLLEAGGDANAVLAALGGELGVWNRKLDWVIVARPGDKDAALWSALADRYSFGGVIYPAGTASDNGVLAQILADCDAAKIPAVPAERGYILEMGDGARVTVLAAEPGQFVLAAEEGDSRWLIPIGLEAELAERLLAAGGIPDAHILFPLAVSADWNASSWLARVNPLAAWSQAGAESGWPDAGLPLRVDIYGKIELATDGSRLWTRVR